MYKYRYRCGKCSFHRDKGRRRWIIQFENKINVLKISTIRYYKCLDFIEFFKYIFRHEARKL